MLVEASDGMWWSGAFCGVLVGLGFSVLLSGLLFLAFWAGAIVGSEK